MVNPWVKSWCTSRIGWEESPASSDVNETDAVEASPASHGEEVQHGVAPGQALLIADSPHHRFIDDGKWIREIVPKYLAELPRSVKYSNLP